MPNYCRYIFKYPSLRLNSVKVCIDQGIRKIKKTSYFIIFVKTILKILYCLNLQSPVAFSSVLMCMDSSLLHARSAWWRSLEVTCSSINTVSFIT